MSSRPVTPPDLLDLVLRGAEDDELRAAIRAAVLVQHMPEGQLIDWKAGALCDDADDFNDELRKMISGFANAEGGVLVVGVGEDGNGNADAFAACARANVLEMASRALVPLLAAQSRPRVLDVDGHRVLVVGVDRSPTLLRYWLRGKPVCFLRLGESTHPVPPYLELDLVTGRRERVSFGLHGQCARGAIGADRLHFHWNLALQNDSLV